jgi:hypothetical protein
MGEADLLSVIKHFDKCRTVGEVWQLPSVTLLKRGR